MNVLRTLAKGFKKPRITAWILINKMARLFSDEQLLKLQYRIMMGRKLNLENPTTFNEKLQWLKIYNKCESYTQMVDKYSAKEYVSSKIGNKYIIPTIGVWSSTDEIEWDKLPNEFVLKTTHGGGNCGVVICKDKETADIKSIVMKLNASMKQDLFVTSREWPYKNVHRRIIAEPYMEDVKTHELRDYKFFCFNGKIKALFIGSERQRREEPFFDFFDSDFNPLPIKQGHPNSQNKPERPVCFEEMKIVASKLSEGIPHVRVDLYEVNGKVYFGELTFFHFGGVVPFEPEEWDYKFGEWIKLPLNKVL